MSPTQKQFSLNRAASKKQIPVNYLKHLLRLALLAFVAMTSPLHAQVIFQQDFSAGGPVTNYAGSPPGIGQFSSLSSQVFLAGDFPPVEADEQITASFDGTESADIFNGKLRFILRSAYRKYASPRAADIGGYFYNSMPSRVTLLRQSLGSPAPTLLYVQFKLRIYNPYINTNNPYAGGAVTLTAPSGQQLGEITHVLGDSGDRLEFGSPPVSFAGEVLVTIVLNHTGTAKSYAGPGGIVETIGGANFDYWINQTKVRDDEPSLTSPPLTLFGIQAKTTEPVTIGTPGIGLPDDPGPATTFTFDDFVIRRDLPAPTLNIQRTSTNTFLLSWPSSFTGFALQQNTNLVTGNWMDVTNAVNATNELNQVVVPPAIGSRFFRLKSE